MKKRPRLRAHAKTVGQNPAAATGSVGAVMTILGRWFGWSLQTQVDVATLFLILVPVLRSWATAWENRNR